MDREYIEPSRPLTHIILLWEFPNYAGVELIVMRIQAEWQAAVAPPIG